MIYGDYKKNNRKGFIRREITYTLFIKNEIGLERLRLVSKTGLNSRNYNLKGRFYFVFSEQGNKLFWKPLYWLSSFFVTLDYKIFSQYVSSSRG